MAFGTWPVMATSGIESSLASAMAVSRLVAPGPDEAQADRWLAGDAGHALGHEAGALFVAGQHVVDRGRLAEGIVDRQDGAARYAGDGADALAFEQAHGDLGAGEGFGHGDLLSGCWLNRRAPKQNPRRFAPAGVGEFCTALCLPDPLRRVRNDAYDDDAYDDRRYCTGSSARKSREAFIGMGLGRKIEFEPRVLRELELEKSSNLNAGSF